VFNDPSIQRLVDQALDRPRTMLVDTRTRREFGPANGHNFGPGDIGQRVEINEQALEIGGLYTCGTGLNAGGAVVVQERDFLRCVPQFRHDQTSLALIQLSRPADAPAVAHRLAAALPDDVDVLTRGEVLDREIRHWVWETNYGLI